MLYSTKEIYEGEWIDDLQSTAETNVQLIDTGCLLS